MTLQVNAPATDYGSIGLGVPQAEVQEQLGQEDFLSLMISQLKNQDPFKPMESGEFLGQLAQFGTVSGLGELKSAFDSLAGSLVSNQSLQAAGLVGRSALVESSAATIAQGQPVAAAVDMPTASGSVKVEIRDGTGELVRALDLGTRPAGLATFTWDGLTDEGTAAPGGRYTFAASFQSEGKMEAAKTLVAAPVESVLFGSKGFSVRLTGVGDVPFNSVREIREPTSAPVTAPAATATN
jgi:flagellar basal-body rod modification protein FlgD